jgi:ectoine hydroxylase
MTVTGVTVADRYPTRGSEPGLMERAEPTVWPGVDRGPATSDDLATHDARGFHTVEGLLSPSEVWTYRQELQGLIRNPALRADERTVVEPSSNDVRSVFDVHRISEPIAALITDARVLDRARQILGSDVYVHQTRINYMPGFHGNGFYWHSDFETWHAEDGMPAMRAVSMSIALTDNYPFNGGLMLIPGAHRHFVSCVGETPEGNHRSSLREQRVGVPQERQIAMLSHEYGIEQFTGAAGSALWFDCNSMHGSGNNITPFPRSNIFVVFNSVENKPVEPFAAPRPRPGYLASRDFTPLRR